MSTRIQDILGKSISDEIVATIRDEKVADRLGQRVMESVAEFAMHEERSVGELDSELFQGIKDPTLRRTLAETLFGARWLYKLGLVTYATGERRAAHIRAQIIDYAAICEAVLGYAILRAIRKGYAKTDCYKWSKPDKFKGELLSWKAQKAEAQMRRYPCSFEWKINAAEGLDLITDRVAKSLHSLRKRRNRVHLATRASAGEHDYITDSANAYRTMHDVVRKIGTWLALHP